jgi:runt-related transcription factor
MHLTANNVNSGSGTNASNNNNSNNNNSSTNTANNGSSNNNSNSNNNNNSGGNNSASGGGNNSNSSNNNSSSNNNNNNSSNNSNNNQPLTPEQILQETYTKMTSDILAERTLGDFMSEHPGELIRTGSPLFVCTVLPSHWRSVSLSSRHSHSQLNF